MERAFLYGDLLFETLLAQHGRIPHIARHYRRLAHSAGLLKMDLCGLNEEKFAVFCHEKLADWISQNPDQDHQRLRFVLYRKSTGNYLPANKLTTFEIGIENLIDKQIPEISRLALYVEQNKAPGKLANLKSGNALIYVMASIWADENKLDGALIQNCFHHIIESNTSNIFWRSGSQWFTPPLSDGCVAGIGRELLMEKYQVTEKSCTPADLLSADERILSNALFPERRFILIEPPF